MRIPPVLNAIIIVAFLCTSAAAQISDSLYNTLPDSLRPKNKLGITDKERSRIILNVSQSVVQKNHSEMEAWMPGMKMRMQAVRPDIEKIPYLDAIAGFYLQSGEYSEQVYWYKKLVSLGSGQTLYRHEVCYAYMNLCLLYAVKQQHDTAINMLHEAQDIAQASNYKDAQKDIYYLYMTIYGNIDMYHEAILYANNYLQTFEPAEKWNDVYTGTVISKTSCFIHLYDEEKKMEYADSVKALVARLLEAKKHEAETWYCIIYNDLAYLYYQQGDYKNAVTYFDSSLQPKYCKPGAYLYEVEYRTVLFRHLALISLGHGEDVAKAQVIAIPKKDFSSLCALNYVIYKYYHARNNSDAALQYFINYKENLDSLNILGQKSKLFEAEQKYSVAQKEAAIAVLEKMNLQQQNTRNIILMTGVIALLAMVLVAVLLYVRNKRQEAQRQAEKQKQLDVLHTLEQEMEFERVRQQAEKEDAIKKFSKTISGNMHDEVASSLAAMYYLVGDLKMQAKEQETKRVLQEIEAEAKNVYQESRDFMHRLANQQNKENYDVTALLENLSARFGPDMGMEILTSVDKGIKQVLTQKQNSELYRIIKEAVTNSLKHSGATQINIDVTINNGHVYFSIKDNGKGLLHVAGAEGMGIKTMREGIEGMAGSISIKSYSSGTEIAGSFPVEDLSSGGAA